MKGNAAKNRNILILSYTRTTYVYVTHCVCRVSIPLP